MSVFFNKLFKKELFGIQKLFMCIFNVSHDHLRVKIKIPLLTVFAFKEISEKSCSYVFRSASEKQQILGCTTKKTLSFCSNYLRIPLCHLIKVLKHFVN